MSLLAMPFVETGADMGLHVLAAIIWVGSIAAGLYGFWKLHELPIHEAHKKSHQQITLITVLTWIGFIWHWVWIVAVFIAFVDIEKSLIRIRDIWKDEGEQKC